MTYSVTKCVWLIFQNPSKPHFNHYLFESICISIRTTCKVNPEAVTSFEQGLFPPFQDILQQDVQGFFYEFYSSLKYCFTTFQFNLLKMFLFSEFIPYVFQILSLMLEMQTSSVPEAYMALFPHLLLPILWERPGNIPPLVRLLQAFIEKGSGQIEAERVVSLLRPWFLNVFFRWKWRNSWIFFPGNMKWFLLFTNLTCSFHCFIFFKSWVNSLGKKNSICINLK